MEKQSITNSLKVDYHFHPNLPASAISAEVKVLSAMYRDANGKITTLFLAGGSDAHTVYSLGPHYKIQISGEHNKENVFNALIDNRDGEFCFSEDDNGKPRLFFQLLHEAGIVLTEWLIKTRIKIRRHIILPRTKDNSGVR